MAAMVALDHADMALPSLDAMPLVELLELAAHTPRKTLSATEP